jgi:uncharacterized membrane protein YccC
MDLNKKNQAVINVTIGLNVLVFLVSLFYSSKWLLITLSISSVILLGTYLIIKKYGVLFSTLLMANSFAKKLNTGLENIEQWEST